MWKFAPALLLSSALAFSAPTANYKGGWYYLYKDGERVEGHYTQDYTAKAAAVNLSFLCNCSIVIKQPDITVTTGYGDDVVVEPLAAIALTWDIPREREDGSPLPENEIAHYLIEANGKQIEVDGLSYVFTDAIQGENVFKIATVDSDGQTGAFSPEVKVVIGE
jgi:hypothetical protein